MQRKEKRQPMPGLGLGTIWRRLQPARDLGYVAFYGRIGLTIGLLLGESLMQLGAPYIFSRMVARLSVPTQLVVLPIGLIVCFGFAMLLRSIFSSLQEVVYQPLSQRLQRLMAQEGLRHLHAMSLRFHLERQTGALTRALERGTDAVDTLMRLSLFNVGPAIVDTVMTLAVVGHLFGGIYAVLLLIGLLSYVGLAQWFVRLRVAARRARNEASGMAQHRLLDSLLNFEAVQHFGNEKHEYRQYAEARRAFERASLRATRVVAASSVAQNVMIALVTSAILYLAARDIVAHRLGVPQFVLIGTYLRNLYQAVISLNFVYAGWRNARVDLENVSELLDRRSEIQAPPIPRKLQSSLAIAGPAAVAFDGVVFGYTADRQILKDVSFNVEPGRRIGIVGPTGSGKSTIGKLLFRAYDPDAGAVLLDGFSLRDLDPQDIRTVVGVVPQETLLFNDTIAYNIGYGRIGADAEEIEQAARAAELHDFIVSLPDGYATEVGERGLKLSGGEKQRIAIARIFLKRPRLLLLDEATSALDTRTEQRVQDSLNILSREQTTIAIAHRLSTVIDCDEILVLESGRIVERGTHSGLLAQGGVYAGMWAAQAIDREQSTVEGGGHLRQPAPTTGTLLPL
ncbi:ABCB family ABC transporter ATP-binding protein/permease [Neoasaia chiangmaiensis]|uniref:ABCB family ABC transporter ATP-binding protein/permease n=2 Tax=Neoasaia chiangmaiensis TaxID=320497 RepID=UPI00098A75D7|nr:ATP-binding cassette domain-containing protein [Neoasaia chiangmaiensis]